MDEDLTYDDPDHLSFDERAKYVRGELDEARRVLVQGHIDECAMCSDEVQDLEAFVESLEVN